jgi:UDP-glucose 4-epimerase
LNIAEFCRIKKIDKLIYLNTYPYGIPKYNPVDEKHIIAPHSPYSKSKQVAEQLLFQYLENEVNITSLRIFNPYGYFHKEDYLIPSLVKQALYSNLITVRDIRPKRDYIYIEDLTSLLKNIINVSDSEGIYNVGYGKSFSIPEIVSVLEGILNKKFYTNSIETPRDNEVLDCYADIKKVTSKFKWTPTTNLTDGIKKYIKWIKKNPNI